MWKRFLHWWRLMYSSRNDRNWCVVYPPDSVSELGGVSVPMDYGTAAGYAEVFGGKIVHSTDIPTLSQPPNTKPRLERVK